MSESKPTKPQAEISVADLLSAALEQADDKAQVEAITSKLARLGTDGVRELFKTEAFQEVLRRVGEAQAAESGAEPGTILTVRQGNFTFAHKVPWTREHIEKKYPKQTMVAWRNEKIMPHGIPYLVTQGVEYTLPSICWDLMRNTDETVRQSRAWAARHFGTEQQVGSSGYYGQIEYGKGYAPEAEDLTYDQINSAQPPAPAAAGS